eukprot:SAG11_NODE_8_length_31217_cov_52.169677_21_plen_118_part_00
MDAESMQQLMEEARVTADAQATVPALGNHYQGHDGSEKEAWLNKINLQYINACSSPDELQKIVDEMHRMGFVGLERAAEDKLLTLQRYTRAAGGCCWSSPAAAGRCWPLPDFTGCRC